MSRWQAKLPWLGGAALFALAPKCLLCLAAYFGLGTVLGLRLAAPELCGGAASPLSPAIAGLWLFSAAVLLGVAVWRRRTARGGLRCSLLSLPTRRAFFTQHGRARGIVGGSNLIQSSDSQPAMNSPACARLAAPLPSLR